MSIFYLILTLTLLMTSTPVEGRNTCNDCDCSRMLPPPTRKIGNKCYGQCGNNEYCESEFDCKSCDNMFIPKLCKGNKDCEFKCFKKKSNCKRNEYYTIEETQVEKRGFCNPCVVVCENVYPPLPLLGMEDCKNSCLKICEEKAVKGVVAAYTATAVAVMAMAGLI